MWNEELLSVIYQWRCPLHFGTLSISIVYLHANDKCMTTQVQKSKQLTKLDMKLQVMTNDTNFVIQIEMGEWGISSKLISSKSIHNVHRCIAAINTNHLLIADKGESGVGWPVEMLSCTEQCDLYPGSLVAVDLYDVNFYMINCWNKIDASTEPNRSAVNKRIDGEACYVMELKKKSW